VKPNQQKMKRYFWLSCFLLPLQLLAQDSTMNRLTQDMDNIPETKMPVKIFNSEKLITANTTEVTGKGKMNFKVTHNFGDIAGKSGGIKSFFGLDYTYDVRIGFDIGLTNRLDLGLAHAKGDEQPFRHATPVDSTRGVPRLLYEIYLKYQLCRQLENDPSHPIALSLFVQSVVSTQTVPQDVHGNVIPNKPISFEDFGDRLSEVVQLIIAKKIKKISLQLNPTLVHYNYVPSYDEATTFALGGAIRVPVSRTFAIIVDYFHPFHSDDKKNNYYNIFKVKFHDPLSIGLEILTAGHNFHLNFTNTTGILESEFIPYTTSAWKYGQYRWGFNLSRKFVLWRPKNKSKS